MLLSWLRSKAIGSCQLTFIYTYILLLLFFKHDFYLGFDSWNISWASSLPWGLLSHPGSADTRFKSLFSQTDMFSARQNTSNIFKLNFPDLSVGKSENLIFFFFRILFSVRISIKGCLQFHMHLHFYFQWKYKWQLNQT